MKRTELDTIIEKHKLWLDDQPGGKRADFTGADLIKANLTRANLTGADLIKANLTRANLTGANLTWADFTGANLTGANLTGANLTGADFTGANLTGANLTGANLTGANLDLASWPLWCGSLEAYVDDRIVIQLLYHTLSVVHYSPYVSQEVKEALLADGNVNIANRFHRVKECGRLSAYADI